MRSSASLAEDELGERHWTVMSFAAPCTRSTKKLCVPPSVTRSAERPAACWADRRKNSFPKGPLSKALNNGTVPLFVRKGRGGSPYLLLV